MCLEVGTICEFMVFKVYHQIEKYIGRAVSWPRLLKGPRISDSPVAMSTPNDHTLFTKHQFPPKGTRAPWRNGWFQGWD